MKNQNKISDSDYFIIPNPIYDVVFKYLMEDNDSAKIILSTLINEKIKKLTFEPVSHTEKIKDPKSEKDIKLFHLDFTAIVELPNESEELIMIEIQKANRASDIFRFKRYISANFQRKQEKEIINPHTQAVEKIIKPIRLIPIFILNFRIENEINDLIIKTNRSKNGLFKEKQLQKKNEFIDNLSFDIWVVQLPNLNKIKKEDYENDEYKTKLYSMLKLFDQKAQKPKNKHRLLLIKKIFPGFLERVIKRLKTADADNPDLEAQMNAEDEYLSELIKRDNTISFIKQKLVKTTEKLENTTEKLETEKKIAKEKDKAIDEKNKAIDEKNKALINSAKIMKQAGVVIEEIQKATGFTKNEIEKL